VGVREVGLEFMDWINLVQDRGQWWSHKDWGCRLTENCYTCISVRLHVVISSGLWLYYLSQNFTLMLL